MCAIIDNNVRHEVFGASDVQTEAGEYFLNWLENRNGRLVVGGKLLEELSDYTGFGTWLRRALVRGRVIRVSDAEVDTETANLQSRNICKSNDAHVLALARVSGARLLFTNDQDLQEDFRNRGIIGGIRGRVYTTLVHQDFSSTHRSLLNRTDLCAA